MLSDLTFPGVLTALLVCLLGYVFWRCSAPTQPRGFSGSKPFPFLGNTVDLIRNNRRMPEWKLGCGRRAVKKGHSIYTLAMPGSPVMYEVLTPELAQHVLKSNFDNYVKGDVLKDIFKELLGEGIFTSDGKQWREQRKVASHMFSQRYLNEHMEEVFLHHAERFVDFLAEQPTDKQLDFQDLFARSTMDSMFEIGFGKTMDSLRMPTVPFARAFDKIQELQTRRFTTPLPWKVLRFLGVPEEREIVRLQKVMDTVAQEIIDARKALASSELEKKHDVLSLFMAHGQGEFNSDYLRDAVMNFLLAGRDTTACALMWLFYRLSRHPDKETKLLQEIDDVLQGKPPTSDALKDMPYLHACICETLRLHPSVPDELKVAVNGDTLPNGTIIPAGSLLGYSPYTFGHLESIWGDDAEDFRPERWIELRDQSDNKIEPVSQYKFISFNAGPRLCLGKPMALLETKILSATILQKFRLRAHVREPIETLYTIILRARDGLHFTLLPRKDGPPTQ